MNPYIEHELQERVSRYVNSVRTYNYNYRCLVKFLNAHPEITESELQQMLLAGRIDSAASSQPLKAGEVLSLAREILSTKGVN